jgi:hypothetical protein
VRALDSFNFLACISDLAVQELSTAGISLDDELDYHEIKFDVMDKKRKIVLTNYGPISGIDVSDSFPYLN